MMDHFSFVMVLLSIIVGLGVTELLTNIARQISSRATIKPYWVHSLAVVIIFIALLQQWWETWDLRSVDRWSFPILLLLLGGPVTIYIMSHLLFPSRTEGTDFRKHYYANSRVFWMIGIVAILLTTSFHPISFGSQFFVLDSLTPLTGVIILLGLAVTKSKIVHQIMVPILLVGLLIDILVFSMSI